jgi:hypothetical protein
MNQYEEGDIPFGHKDLALDLFISYTLRWQEATSLQGSHLLISNITIRVNEDLQNREIR